MGKYGRLVRRSVDSVEYWTQAVMRRFVLDVSRRMHEQDISRAVLAERIKASPAYVTKVLRGDVNFTLETMTKLSLAVGGRLHIEIVDRSARWRPSAWHLVERLSGSHVGQAKKIEFPIATNDASFDYELGRAA